MNRLKDSDNRVVIVLDRLIFGLLVVFLFASAFSIALSEIGYFSAFVFWIGKMVYTKRNEIPSTPLDYFFLAYVAAEIIATIFTREHLYSLLYLERRMLLLPIIYVLISATKSKQHLQWLAWAMLGSAIAVSLFSFWDLIVHLSEYIHYQRRLGEFQIYMTAGGIMMVALLMTIPFIVHPSTPRKQRLLLCLCAVPLTINLLFTFTRSSWLGFFGGVIVIAFVRSKKIFLAAAALLILVFVFASPEIKERIYSIVDPNHPANVSRVNMWRTGLRIIKDHPIVGIGDIGTETVWDQYSDPGWQWEGHLHNNLIMWFVTLGGIGFTALVALFVKMWLVIKKIEKRLRLDWFSGSLALGGLAVLIGFHINGLFEWNFGDAEIITLIWAIVGLILTADKIAQSTSSAA